MSLVTDIVLLTHCGEDGEAVALLNAQFAKYERAPLLRVDPLWKFGKSMQTDVWIGAYNYFPTLIRKWEDVPYPPDIGGVDDYPVRALLEFCKTLPWEFPEHVCFVITQEHYDSPKLFRLKEEPNE